MGPGTTGVGWKKSVNIWLSLLFPATSVPCAVFFDQQIAGRIPATSGFDDGKGRLGRVGGISGLILMVFSWSGLSGKVAGKLNTEPAKQRYYPLLRRRVWAPLWPTAWLGWRRGNTRNGEGSFFSGGPVARLWQHNSTRAGTSFHTSSPLFFGIVFGRKRVKQRHQHLPAMFRAWAWKKGYRPHVNGFSRVGDNQSWLGSLQKSSDEPAKKTINSVSPPSSSLFLQRGQGYGTVGVVLICSGRTPQQQIFDDASRLESGSNVLTERLHSSNGSKASIPTLQGSKGTAIPLLGFSPPRLELQGL